MFELLPEVGLRLPDRAGTLRLGMDERAARWAVATVADVRDGWVCGASWAFSARYRGLMLNVYGDTTGRRSRHQDTPAWPVSVSAATPSPSPGRQPAQSSFGASISSATRPPRFRMPSARACPDAPAQRQRSLPHRRVGPRGTCTCRKLITTVVRTGEAQHTAGVPARCPTALPRLRRTVGLVMPDKLQQGSGRVPRARPLKLHRPLRRNARRPGPGTPHTAGQTPAQRSGPVRSSRRPTRHRPVPETPALPSNAIRPTPGGDPAAGQQKGPGAAGRGDAGTAPQDGATAAAGLTAPPGSCGPAA